MSATHKITIPPHNKTKSNSPVFSANSKSSFGKTPISKKKNIYIFLRLIIIIILTIIIALTIFFVLKLRKSVSGEHQTQHKGQAVESPFLLLRILDLEHQKEIQQKVLNSNLSITKENSHELLSSLLKNIYRCWAEVDVISDTIEAKLINSIKQLENFIKYIETIKFPEEELSTDNSSSTNLLIILRWFINLQKNFLHVFSLTSYSLSFVVPKIKEQSYGLFYFYLASREFLGVYLEAKELLVFKGAVYLEEYLETIPFFTNEESEYFKLKKGVEDFLPLLLCSKNFTYEANLNGDSESTKFEFDLLIEQIEVFKSLMYFHQLWVCEILFEGIFEEGNSIVLRKSIFKELLESKDEVRKRWIEEILDSIKEEEVVSDLLRDFRVWRGSEKQGNYIVAEDGRKLVNLQKNRNLKVKIFSDHYQLLTKIGKIVESLLE